MENKQELWYNLFKGNLGEVGIKNMNDIFFDKNFNRKILKMGKFTNKHVN
ncbi:MAG: hypothetical protein ACLTCQ_04845 [Enterocloster bolteae]